MHRKDLQIAKSMQVPTKMFWTTLKGKATTLRCDVVSQKQRRTADCQISDCIGNFHDPLWGVVIFYDATPQRSDVASP